MDVISSVDDSCSTLSFSVRMDSSISSIVRRAWSSLSDSEQQDDELEEEEEEERLW